MKSKTLVQRHFATREFARGDLYIAPRALLTASDLAIVDDPEVKWPEFLKRLKDEGLLIHSTEPATSAHPPATGLYVRLYHKLKRIDAEAAPEHCALIDEADALATTLIEHAPEREAARVALEEDKERLLIASRLLELADEGVVPEGVSVDELLDASESAQKRLTVKIMRERLWGAEELERLNEIGKELQDAGETLEAQARIVHAVRLIEELAQEA